MSNYYDYHEAGFHVLGLYALEKGVCTCERENCPAAGKHPLSSAWQYTPHWEDAQIEAMDESDQFKTGFAVLCDGYLIIDIDPRNGGGDSYEKLKKDTAIDFKKESGFVVATGGGGWHIYFKHDGEQLKSKLDKYPGVDFKTSGFVVGAGSLHKSGLEYEVEKGAPDEIKPPPAALVELLKRPALPESSSIKAGSATELAEMLNYIIPYDYETWIQCGMACNHALGDEGFVVWDEWSRHSDKYNSEEMHYKWHSFGKSSRVVTAATIAKLAMDAGYIKPVTFQIEDTSKEEHTEILRPPGLVGECCDYINSRSRYPREALAISAALSAVATIGGMHFNDVEFGATANLFTFNVAASATGKEAIQQSHNELLIAAGFGSTVYGTIKSEQEIYKNIIRHQCANYLIDEFGILLNKIEKAGEGASYLAGVTGALMSIYSKANGLLPLGADVGEDLRSRLAKQIAALKKLEDNNEAKAHDKLALQSAKRLLEQINKGFIDRPFLTLAGYTTPSTFNNLVSFESATAGFIGRALIFEEKNNNPRIKKGKLPEKGVPKKLDFALKRLAGGGSASMDSRARVESLKQEDLHTDAEAIELLGVISDELHEYAERMLNKNGLEAIARSGFELVLKVSMILAIGDGGVRTVDHVKWAYSVVRADLDNKINLTEANMASEDEDVSAETLAKVRHQLDKDSGVTSEGLKAKLRSLQHEHIKQALDFLESKSIARREGRHWFLV